VFERWVDELKCENPILSRIEGKGKLMYKIHFQIYLTKQYYYFILHIYILPIYN